MKKWQLRPSSLVACALALLAPALSFAQASFGVEGGGLSLGTAYAGTAPFLGASAAFRNPVCEPRLALGCVGYGLLESDDSGDADLATALKPYLALSLEKPLRVAAPGLFLAPGLGVSCAALPAEELSLEGLVWAASASLRAQWRTRRLSLSAFAEAGLARLDAEGAATVLDGLGLPALRLGAGISFP